MNDSLPADKVKERLTVGDKIAAIATAAGVATVVGTAAYNAYDAKDNLEKLNFSNVSSEPIIEKSPRKWVDTAYVSSAKDVESVLQPNHIAH